MAGGADWRAAAAAAVLAVACAPLTAAAQRGNGDVPRFEEAPMPPRIDEVTPNERALANNPADNPNRARLAPLPEGADEVVVTAEEPSWRQLPDLGSAWRAQQEAELKRRRYIFAIFPRDETTPTDPLMADPFLVNRDGLPSGEINIVRFRFGRRDRAAEPDAR